MDELVRRLTDGPVLAHYGGAPEALTFALPVAIVTGFVLLERRARRREREVAEQDAAGVDDGGSTGSAGAAGSAGDAGPEEPGPRS